MKPMSWRELQVKLMAAKTEAAVLALMNEEKQGARRTRWIRRIFHRYRRLRSKNELKQLKMTGRQATAKGVKKNLGLGRTQ